MALPAGYGSVNGTTQVATLSNSSGNVNVYFYITPLYQVTGHVYTDFNHNRTQDTGEPNYTASSLTVSDGIDTVATDGTGAFTFPRDLVSGSYTITLQTIPVGYQGTVTSQGVTVGPDASAALAVTPLYQISGTIYTDVDLSHCYNPAAHGCTYNGVAIPAGADSLFTQNSHLVLTGPTNTTVSTTTGVYSTPQSLLSGTYTMTYDTATTPLPTGYRFVGPSSWIVTLGDPTSAPRCAVGAIPDATCGNPNNGSVSHLDFGLSNETAWPQPLCGDARFDGGYAEQIPSTANCNGTAAPYAVTTNNLCSNPGVLFSGTTDPSYGSGLGASTSNRVVGNSLFPELYTYHLPNTSDTSYSFITTTLNNLTATPTPLTSICPNLSNCVLSETTPGGVYTTQASDGPVSLSVSNSDGSYKLGAADYVFNIGGDLSFTSNVILQSGYSASFTSGGNIHVTGVTALGNAGEVGETDWTSMNPDLEGFFTANGNFSIDRVDSAAPVCNNDGSPIDKKLNVVGSVITNAGSAGGSLVNNREGCAEDLSCPAVTFTNSPIQILHASAVLRPGNTFWQELNP